ncbi:MAG: MgtC/SapB family protein [Treponema sp.]|nr:MgtC/SapB family protein [Treponema sp.]
MFDFVFDEKFIECCARILLSGVFGIVLGIERKNHFQAIGMRTLLLISVSCALMGVLSFWAAAQHERLMGDPTRIAAGVLTGIGFIGGGAIMHQGFNIKGITTAAIIWTTAALSLAVGFGIYLPALSAFALVLVGLKAFQKVEDILFPAAKIKNIALVYKGGDVDIGRIKKILLENGIVERDINFCNSYADDLLEITILVNTPDERDLKKLAQELKQTGALQKFSFS